MEIVYTDWNVANCFDNNKEKWIEINKNLKDYPELHNKILSHELEHLNSEDTTDIKIELKSIFKSKYPGLIKFMFKHPKSFTQFLPFSVNKNGFFPDYFMLLLYGGAVLTGVLIALIL